MYNTYSSLFAYFCGIIVGVPCSGIRELYIYIYGKYK